MRSVRHALTFLASAILCAGTTSCMVGEDPPPDEGPIVSDDAEPITHPDMDSAGSQILAIEGNDSTGEAALAVAQSPGMDVSSFQGNINWGAAKANGARFAYIKATEGVTYRNPYFGSQYTGSYNAGIIRGAYHFALPDRSSGTTQADFFVDHGGGWSKDGKTFPPAIDLEWNPYGSSCYGKSASQMVAWIHAFANRVKARTGRDPVFYTSTSWWSLCTGNNGGFGANPLWVARYSSSVGTLPRSWSVYTIWQNADHGVFPGDHDLFNGDATRVKAFAL
jgi:GH25 family lysozyme M1 (1,4-beta-N-acetylmuramidase)